MCVAYILADSKIPTKWKGNGHLAIDVKLSVNI